MPLPRELREQLAASHRRAAEEADREMRRDLVRTAIACVLWCGIGLALMGWGLHTTDATLGRIAFFGGIGLGNGGIVFALLSAYRRGEERGDW